MAQPRNAWAVQAKHSCPPPNSPTHYTLPHLQVTADTSAEFFSPPSLALPGRPKITRVGQFPQNKPRIVVGDQIAVEVQTSAPIKKALLIRASSTTHSMPFGECSAGLVCRLLDEASGMRAALLDQRVELLRPREAAHQAGGRPCMETPGLPHLCPAPHRHPTTPSCSADARALWLPIVDTLPNGVVLQLPTSANVLIPGM